VAANPQTKPAEKCQLPFTSIIAIVIITQPASLSYRPTKGGRLSRPRHCSTGAQPVPKAVYRSGCCDEHTWPYHTAVRRAANQKATETCLPLVAITNTTLAIANKLLNAHLSVEGGISTPIEYEFQSSRLTLTLILTID